MEQTMELCNFATSKIQSHQNRSSDPSELFAHNFDSLRQSDQGLGAQLLVPTTGLNRYNSEVCVCEASPDTVGIGLSIA